MSKSKRKHHRSVSANGSTAVEPHEPYVKAVHKPPEAHKKHGGWLTAMIIIIALHGIFDAVAMLTMPKTEYANQP